MLLNLEKEKSLRKNEWAASVRDSKKISEKKREKLEPLIQKHCDWRVSHVPASYIDRYGINAAIQYGAHRIYRFFQKQHSVHAVVMDGNYNFSKKYPGRAAPLQPFLAVRKGDDRLFPVAMASILAKTARDRMIKAADSRFSVYGLRNHKGYATAAHRKAIRKFGPSPYHRRCFLKNLI